MDCTHCSREFGIGSFTLRFSPEGRESVKIDLRLCNRCVERFLTETEIELVKPPVFMA